MKVQLRPNLWIADTSEVEKLMKSHPEINRFVIVDDSSGAPMPCHRIVLVKGPNPGHIKDLACHVPKYMMQNGDQVAVVSANCLEQAAYVVCRAICELEQKSIYDVYMELKAIEPEFDVAKAYF